MNGRRPFPREASLSRNGGTPCLWVEPNRSISYFFNTSRVTIYKMGNICNHTIYRVMKNTKKIPITNTFESFIDNWRGRLFTKKGDAIWRKFVDHVVSPALGNDHSHAPLDPRLLERIITNADYADEYKARILFVTLIPPQTGHSSIYWPYKRIVCFKEPLSTMSQSLRLFLLEVIVRSIAFLTSADSDPCRQQWMLHQYISKSNASLFLPDLIDSIHDQGEVEKVFDMLITEELACSFDNFDSHPLSLLYRGALSEQFKMLLDRKVQSVIACRIKKQSGAISEQGETLSKYIFLTCATLTNQRHRETHPVSPVRLVQQLRFILDTHAHIQCPLPRIHRIDTLDIPRIFRYIQGIEFKELRREVSLFVLTTNDDLYLRTNVMGHEAACNGARLMLASLMPNDTDQIIRIQEAITAYQIACADEAIQTDLMLKKRTDETNTYCAKRDALLTQMAASHRLTSQP